MPRDNGPRPTPLTSTGLILKTLLFLAFIAVVILLVRSLIFGAAKRSRREPIDSTAEEVAPKALPPPESATVPEATATAIDPAAVPALTLDEVFTRLYALALSTPDLVPLEQLTDDSPRRNEFVEAFGPTLERVAAEPKYSPRRPLLLPQLLRAVNDDDVSQREIANIIARDPALAGNLLKLANSSFYRVNAQAVESVDRAVALLGTEGIRSLIVTALVQPVFRSAGVDFVQFAHVAWEYTFRSATAAESHAAVVENTDPFAAQLLGLVMGLGAFIVFRVAVDQFAARAHKPDAVVVAHLLKMHTAQVARQVAASWDLSDRMLTALDEQNPTVPPAPDPTALGRSLQFGRLLGALAVLNANDRVDDETAKAAILATGASPRQFDRFWMRLTGRPSVLEPKPHRPPSTLAD